MSEQWKTEQSIERGEPELAAGSELVDAQQRAAEMDAWITEEPSRTINVVSRAVDALRRRGVKAAEIIALLTATGLGACATARGEEIRIHGTDDYKSAPTAVGRQRDTRIIEMPAAAPLAEEHVERDKLRAELIEATGIDLMAIAEKAGFEVKMEVANGQGSYYLKVDQYHHVPGLEKDAKRLRRVLVSQKGVYALLGGLAETNKVSDLFPEAITEKNVGDFHLMREAHSYFDDPRGGVTAFESFDHRLKRAYEIGRKARFLDGYLYRDRYEAFERAAETDPALATAMAKTRQTIHPLLYDEMGRLGSDEKFLGGAAGLAVLEGKFTVHPGETEAASQAADGSFERMQAAYDKYMTADVNALTPAEAQSRLEAYEAVRRAEFKKIDTDREVAGLQQVQMAVRGQKVKGRLFAAVWGAAHDFKPEVEEFNTSVQFNEKLGLIRFTQKNVLAGDE
jgi:hypothetical protein